MSILAAVLSNHRLSPTTLDQDAGNTESRRVRAYTKTATEQAFRVSCQIVGTALILALCMWSFIGWSIWSEYSISLASSRTQESNLIAAFCGELTVTFESVSGALQFIQNEVEAMPRSASPDEIRSSLRQATRDMTGPFRTIRVAGPDGKILFSTARPDPGPADIHDTPGFIRHRDDPNTGLIVDPPNTDDPGPRRMVTVSRRLHTADGQFAGEAVLLINPGSLIGLQRQIDLGRRGVVVIAGANGIILAGYDRQHPDGTVGVGTDLRGAPYPADLHPGTTVDYVRHSRVDGVDRLIAVRQLKRYPLNVLVGLDMDDVLGVARGHAWLIASVGAGTTGLIAVLTLLLVREGWRRTRRDIELVADRERLQNAQHQIDIERERLAETNQALVDSTKRAEVANRTQSQFLAHMSHELRTPLHAIIGFSELIRDQAPTTPGSPPIAMYAADILTSGRHLLDVINTILDITKIESGSASLTERLFPFADLARNAIVSVRARADAHHITVDLRLPNPSLRLFADRTRLLTVLINLLANAVKFTPDDGRITLSAEVDPDRGIILSVTDSGIGMTEAEIAIALEPFGQVDTALSRTFQGTGLGLPLAVRLVELHGGRLELISRKGHGTTACIVLPVWRTGTPPEASAA